MTRRALSLLFVAWALGFAWFAINLPQPAATSATDAIVVPTGSGGRIGRGLEMLRLGAAEKMLVTGVDSRVKPGEFAAEYGVSDRLMDCCVTLGFAALDTRGNARETANWIAENGYTSLRLVTADWHMRRAALEIAERLPPDVRIVRDAVHSQADLGTLFLEYHKWMFAWLLGLQS